MADHDRENIIEGSGGQNYSLDDILEEFKDGGSPDEAPFPPAEEEQPGRAVVLEPSDEGMGSALLDSRDVPDDTAGPPLPKGAVLRYVRIPASPDQPGRAAAGAAKKTGDIAAPGVDKAAGAAPEAGEEPAPQKPESVTEAYVRALVEEDERGYASAGFTDESASWEPRRSRKTERHRSFAETLLTPLVMLLAMASVRKSRRAETSTDRGKRPEADESVPEMPPKAAAKLYHRQVHPLRMRGRIALPISAALVWLSYGLPAAGALSYHGPALALTLLILELTVVMLGLDIFTKGVLSLLRGRPGAESLISVSCVMSALDAAIMAFTGNFAFGIPYCAVSALSMLFAIHGARHTCQGLATSFRVLAQRSAPYSVTAESGVVEGGVALLKSRRDPAGFVRRSEDADMCEELYSLLSPILFALFFILTILSSVISGDYGAFLHVFSALTAAAASFSALLSFPLPFSITARKLAQSGAAVAGFVGTRDIGLSRHVIVTDADIFPAGTLVLDNIRVLEGVYTDKVIAYTGSIIGASGSGLAPVFTELMKRNGCTMLHIEDFSCHEGGGLTAIINGEKVLVGSSGFMHLSGVRIPRRLASKTSVFTAVGSELVGIFSISYAPVGSVQDALALLLHSRREPIFAIRDFNITPLMIRQKFKMPTDSFNFPNFAERYRISSAKPSESSKIAAILSREGLSPLVEAADRGWRLYFAARISTFLCALSSFLGPALIFMLCASGAFDSATAGNLMSFMFFWMVPLFVLSMGLRR